VTDNLLKLPDIENIMQKNSLNSTPEPSNEIPIQKKFKGSSMPASTTHNICKDEVVRL
jgi:hypothetical protein